MKKKRKNFKGAILILIVTLIISITTYSFADVGSFDRYDSGSSDWSSSSSDWGSDWESSSSSWDDDYSSLSDGDIGFLIGLLFGSHGGRIFLVILIVIYIIYKNKNKENNKENVQEKTTYVPQNTQNYQQNNANISKEKSLEVAKQVVAIDPLFSEEKFTTYTKELFVKLQNAWTAREWEPMRLFETESLFEQHKSQVQGYIDTNRINVMDRISVNYAYLYSFRQEGDKDILEVALKSTMKDYIIDATTKELLEGSKTEDRHTIYKLTFERKKGVQTEEGTDEVKTTNCPNCGAPTKITSSGRCEYCDSIITTGEYDWILSNLEPLR